MCLAHNKNDCKQALIDTRTCGATKCEKNWGEWKATSTCGRCYRYGSKKPIQKFIRSCENPRGCKGEVTKNQECNVEYCRGNHWSKWSEWSTCKGLRGNCGVGTRKRTRTCLAGRGKCTPGSDTDPGVCQLKEC